MTHDCEWCEEQAEYRYVHLNGYERYACRDSLHREKVLRLAFLDRGARMEDLQISICGNGFEVEVDV